MQNSELTISDLITLTEAAQRLPHRSGNKIHVSTLWRWCHDGLKGVTLRYVRVGRRIMVTEQWLHQFFVEMVLADQAKRAQPKSRKRRQPRTNSTREKALEEANAILKRAGILV